VLVVLALLAPQRAGNRANRAAALRAAIAEDRFIDLARERAARELTEQARPHVKPVAPALLAVATGSWTAGVVHAVVCPEHFREATRFGLFFAAIALVQLALGALVLRSGQRRWLVISAVVNAETALLWAFVHSVGLPFGLAAAEPIGALDVLATVTEVVAVLGAFAALAQQRAGRRPVPASV
jgi:hypothetical protein